VDVDEGQVKQILILEIYVKDENVRQHVRGQNVTGWLYSSRGLNPEIFSDNINSGSNSM